MLHEHLESNVSTRTQRCPQWAKVGVSAAALQHLPRKGQHQELRGAKAGVQRVLDSFLLGAFGLLARLRTLSARKLLHPDDLAVWFTVPGTDAGLRDRR